MSTAGSGYFDQSSMSHTWLCSASTLMMLMVAIFSDWWKVLSFQWLSSPLFEWERNNSVICGLQGVSS